MRMISQETIMREVRRHLADVQVFNSSTNAIGTLLTSAGKVIVKRQLLSNDDLSPFWTRMRVLFDSDFTSQRAAMPEIVRLLNENPHIPAASLIGTDEEEKLSVFSFMEGDAREPDEFPEGEKIAYRLGQYIGFLHTREFPFCGLPGGQKVTDFPERLRRYIAKKAAGQENIPAACQTVLSEGLPATTYSLMMADISANQFLFRADDIAAVVDFDAYVIGPREWELELIEAVVSDMTSFKKGYETYRPYPDMTCTRGLYDFVMN